MKESNHMKRKTYYYIVMDWKTQKPILEDGKLPIYYLRKIAREVVSRWDGSYLLRIDHTDLMNFLVKKSFAVK